MPNISVNGQSQQVDANTSVADLLNTLELTGKRIAVECNGQIIPKSDHGQTRLNDGDTLEIVVAVGGG